MCAKVSLTLAETKTKVDLTKESKNVDLTWDEATGTWESTGGTWDRLTPGTLEAKSKVSLSLEAK